MKYSSSVNNYRETPYIVSDTFANKVNYTATIKGAIYFAIDGASLNEPSIFQANGTIWVPVGGYGIGTDATLQDVTTNGKTTNQGITITAGGLSTNRITDTELTAKSIPFVGTAGLITQDNTNLVWDNVNKWIGIQTNVPTAEVDIHTTTATPAIVINNTAGLASRIGFQNTNVSKWTIGNSATNTLNFFNSVLGSIAAYFDGANNNAVFNGTITGNSTITAVERLNSGTTGLFLKQNSGATANGYTGIGTSTTGSTELMNFQWAEGTQANLYFSNAATWGYTFPNANGTIALTSNLSSYLPLAGGTLSGTLNGTNANFNGILDVSEQAFIRGNNSIYRTHEFTTGAANVALYDQRNAAGTVINRLYAGGVSFITGGNLLIGSTTDDTVNKLQVTGSAKITSGIEFVNSSALVNSVLNDYEIGTWTPTITAISGSYTTVTNQRGSYTKVGRMVIIQLYFIVSNKGTGSGGVQISNLPFTSKTGSAGDNYTGTGIDTSSSILQQISLSQNSTTAFGLNYLGLDGIVVSHGNNFTLTYEANF
jgi:hypothetical protein